MMKLFSSSQDYRPVVERDKQTTTAGMFESVRFLAAGMMNKRSSVSSHHGARGSKTPDRNKPLPYPIKRSSSTEKTGVLTFATTVSESLSEEFSNAFHNTLNYFDPLPSQTSTLSSQSQDDSDITDFYDVADEAESLSHSKTGEAKVKNDAQEKGMLKQRSNSFSLHPSASCFELEQAKNDKLLEELHEVEHAYENIELHIHGIPSTTTESRDMSSQLFEKDSLDLHISPSDLEIEQAENDIMLEDLQEVEQEFENIDLHIRAAARTSFENLARQRRGVDAPEDDNKPSPFNEMKKLGKRHSVGSLSTKSQDDAARLGNYELNANAQKRKAETGVGENDINRSRKDEDEDEDEMKLKPVVHVPLQLPKVHSDMIASRPAYLSEGSSPLHSLFSSVSDSSENTGGGSREMSLFDATNDDDDDDLNDNCSSSQKADGESKHFGGEDFTPRSTYTMQSEYPDDDTVAVLAAAFSQVMSCSFYPMQQPGIDGGGDERGEGSTPQATAHGQFFRDLYYGCAG
ncbi:hypothetical protein ACA910_004361 [Epithemia clementina (nom. ined.)]